MVEDVIFHEFADEAVDRASGCSETTEDLGALLVGVQALEQDSSWPITFLVRLTKSSFSLEVCDILLDYPIRVGYQIKVPTQ